MTVCIIQNEIYCYFSTTSAELILSVLNHEDACEVEFIAALISSALEFGDSSVSFCDVLRPREKPSVDLIKRY